MKKNCPFLPKETSSLIPSNGLQTNQSSNDKPALLFQTKISFHVSHLRATHPKSSKNKSAFHHHHQRRWHEHTHHDLAAAAADGSWSFVTANPVACHSQASKSTQVSICSARARLKARHAVVMFLSLRSLFSGHNLTPCS